MGNSRRSLLVFYLLTANFLHSKTFQISLGDEANLSNAVSSN